MPHSIPKELQIGSRVRIGEDRATIKYIGSVGNTKGEWLGVEWDDAARGKNDGTHEGKSYFTCQYPTSGSFIRYHPDKVQIGRSFLEALREKYLTEDDTMPYDKEADRGEIYVGNIKFETVGFQKIQQSQSNLGNLKVVGLAEQDIAYCNPSDELLDLRIEDLDLSRNLISNWKTIVDIVSKLTNLKILRLNQLRFSKSLDVDLQTLSFPNIHTLTLNQTLIEWNDIEPILHLFPNLQDLQLGCNKIKDLKPFNNQYQVQLTCLNLENNLISDWQQILRLSDIFPNLDTLFLNDNRISTITATTATSTAAPALISNLKYLRIEQNRINDWKSIDAFNAYTNLRRLKCKGNPIFADLDTDTQLAHIVGRIKHVDTVNGTTITKRERIDFERYFLKKAATDQDRLHNKRFQELCLLHGNPSAAYIQQNQPTPSLLKNRLTELTLSLYRADDHEMNEFIQSHLDQPISIYQLPPTMRTHTESMQKKCLPTMTIRNLKSLIQPRKRAARGS
ncbi:hypothetical protein BDF20DRAFT_838458 [Mycotypha africana]|uniref:uncharacterized protein n=1 Tax=Mycotypha africana TaxID=64632 RepID=UPI0023011A5B|nr:uncharacterized protein BDF20DRAFT_838458 [Mycotypha africana]KAI8970061.1 hypothetical protein BDF20DRAFT_838458 [Mycotypha africana]